MAINNYQRFFAMFKKLQQAGMKMERDEFLHEQTGKSSLKQLSDFEYNEVCRVMQVKLKHLPPTEYEKVCDRKRKKLISDFRAMNYAEPVEALKKWVVKQKFKKELKKHTSAELSVLIAITEKMLKQYETEIRNTEI